MAKMLVEKTKELDATNSDLLASLLEMTNESEKTALLIACEKKDYGIIELLVEAGADLKASDADGNSAILLAAFSNVPDAIPCKILSPTIFKVIEFY